MMMAVSTTTNRALRSPRQPRVGFATSRAAGPTFQQLSRTAGAGATTKTKAYAPFRGAEAATYKRKWSRYAVSAQGCIARAIAEPLILKHLADRSEATAPELVVLGEALLNGMTLGVDLFFQSATFRDPVFNPSGRSFPVDILKVQGGTQWYEPVDGVHYHNTAPQRAKDQSRNADLAAYGGTVVVIYDTICTSREQLRAFLDSVGAP